MAEYNKVKIEGAAQKPKKAWVRKAKKPNFTGPTPGLGSIYFKFRYTQDAAGSVETKDKLEINYVVSYKHNSAEAGKFIIEMEDPSYT